MKFDMQAMDMLLQTLEDMAIYDLDDMQLKTGVQAALNQVRDEARARIHSITGTLRKAVQTKVKSSPYAPLEAEVGVSYKTTKARYAHLVEGGHGGPHPAPAHPFFAPALAKFESQGVDAIETAMLEAIKKKWK